MRLPDPSKCDPVPPIEKLQRIEAFVQQYRDGFIDQDEMTDLIENMIKRPTIEINS